MRLRYDGRHDRLYGLDVESVSEPCVEDDAGGGRGSGDGGPSGGGGGGSW